MFFPLGSTKNQVYCIKRKRDIYSTNMLQFCTAQNKTNNKKISLMLVLKITLFLKILSHLVILYCAKLRECCSAQNKKINYFAC